MLHRRLRSSARSGWAMVVVILVIVAASAALALMLLSSTSADRSANVMRHSSAARFRAEGALAAAERELVQAIAGWQPAPTTGMVPIDGVPAWYEIEATGFALTDTDATGIQSTRTRYRVQGTALVHGSQETALAMVDVVSVPIFQFAVFYTGDLEINPGPDMTLSGRVHTNGDLYLNCGGTLTLDSNYVHAVGDLLRRRKDDPARSEGTVNVREWVANPFDPSEPSSFFALLGKSQMASQGVVSASGYDSAFTAGFDAEGDGDYYGPNDWLPWALGALEYWSEPDAYANGEGTTIQTADHGLSEAVTPGVGSLAMFEPSAGGDFELDPVSGEYVPVAPGTGSFAKGFFHGQAGLSVLAHEDGTWQAFDERGNDITDTLAASAAISIETLYDARQGGDVSVVQVDVGLLDGLAAFPDNGLLYAASYGIGTGADLAGVRLVNGAELAAPLTVVSEGAVYVQGDYNTVDKKGAAVLADAVNLLSNAWNDSKGSSGLPRASETTFNLAFISGNHDTAVGAYNGGFENLPRFHEDWSGVPCRITGSFVNAWTSRYATGEWVYGGNRYTAPSRLWSYDASFNDAANLPPFTPLVVTGEHVVSWAPAVL